MSVNWLSVQLMLMLAALLPSAVLLFQVYRLDSIEKEPKRLLAGLVGVGALAGVAACALELGLLYLLRRLMPGRNLMRLLIENFLIVGLLEECCKFLPVRAITWRHPAFNYQFDAVVYCVFAALGFAALENVLYVGQFGLTTALTRALLAVPGHFFFAVYMGVYLGEAKRAELRQRRLLVEVADGRKRYLLEALAVPALLHGFWDFTLASGSRLMAAVFYVFVLAFFADAFLRLRHASLSDMPLI